MKFESKYTKELFLKIIPLCTPKSTSDFCAEMGCVKNTANKFLKELEEEGKIKRFRVRSGSRTGEMDIWIRKEEKS